MRHELKYYATDSQLVLLGLALDKLMQPDSHQGKTGYKIKSLYFDTEDDRYLEESINGTDNRKKFRIRIYNGQSSLINLEKKITVKNLKDKNSCILTKETAELLINNKEIFIDGDTVFNELLILRKTLNIKPKCIIEYDRYAYVSDIGNVRITFDRNIRTSSNTKDFFSDQLMLPILENNVNILEVKYDGILPGYISRIINSMNIERTSISKYALCRQFLENNGGI